jgi:DNA replication licensing factor MCM2
LEVHWEDLIQFNKALAMAVVDAPKTMLDILHKAALEVVLEDFPQFDQIHKEIFVRFPELSLKDPIRDLRWLQTLLWRWTSACP